MWLQMMRRSCNRLVQLHMDTNTPLGECPGFLVRLQDWQQLSRGGGRAVETFN